MADSGTVTEEDVKGALARVEDPERGGDLVSRNLLRKISIVGGRVSVEIALPTPGSPSREELDHLVRIALLALPGLEDVELQFTLDVPRRGDAGGADLVPGVRNIIAVGSGKGGVGKSTVAVNLAAALALDGARVGLLDADVYGPSIPTMMGVRIQPSVEDGKMIPILQHGVKLMSLGFLMPDNQTHVVWRGPMVGSAVRQMLAETIWGDLDYLLVDLPPGTGDAQLTLVQSVPLTGAVVVMTSQDVAVGIASKAVGMFTQLKVPILGVVGNMDEFVCPHCKMPTPIFTRGGSEEAAKRMSVPFLGSIPLDPATVEHGDHGTPTVVAAPATAQAQAFRAVARRVAAQVTSELLGAPSSAAGISGLLNRFKKG